jgi:hypothetical protein
MISAPPLIAELRLPPLLHRYLLCLIVVAALVVVFSGCSVLGIASEGYVEDRVEAVNEHTAVAAAHVAETAEPILPGFSNYVGSVFRDTPTSPPPAPDPAFPWLEVIGIVGAAFGVSVPAAVGATNHIRDKSRRERHEATSVGEALAKGYHLDGTGTRTGA